MSDQFKNPPGNVTVSSPTKSAGPQENGTGKSTPGTAQNHEAGLQAALNLIAEQAQLITRASGAAIAVKKGELMVCRARAGQTAPEIGTPLDVSSGLSGECVRSGRMLLCRDSESDPRVDLAACRQLGVRSIVVMPVLVEQHIVGIFEVFSPLPSAFGDTEIAALESMLDLIISVVRPGPAPSPEKAPSLAPAQSLPASRNEPSPTSLVTTQPSPAPVRIFGRDFEIPESKVVRPTGNQNLDDEFLASIASAKLSKPRLFGRKPKDLMPSDNYGTLTDVAVVQPGSDDDLLCEIETGEKDVVRGPITGLGTFAAGDPKLMPPSETWVSKKLIIASCVAIVLGLMWLAWGSRAEDPVPLPDPPPPADIKPGNSPTSSTAPAPVGPSTHPATAAVETNPLPSAASDENPKLAEPSDRLSPKLTKSANVQPTVRPGKANDSHKTLKIPDAPLKTPSKPSTAALNKSDAPGPSPPAVASSTNSPVPADVPNPPASSSQVSVNPPPPPQNQNPHRGIDLSQGVVSAVGVPAATTNEKDVLDLLQASAKAGDPNAQLALAVRYADGTGVRQSYSEAMKWFSKAEAQGVFPQDPKARDARQRAAQMGR